MKISDILFQNKQKTFDRICRANDLKIDFDQNKIYLSLIQQIFEEREYADYFPFYEKACVVDVGAHCGYFSLFASQNLRNESRIIAIEPEAGNYNQLKLNLNSATFQNIEPVNVAIAGSDGEMNLYLGSGINHSLVSGYALNTQNAQGQKVRTMSLSSLFIEKKITQIDFLKMDCEGAEYEIIHSTPKDIFDCITTISMEFHDLKNEHSTGNTLMKKFIGMGFTIVKFRHEKTTRGLNFGKLIATKMFPSS